MPFPLLLAGLALSAVGTGVQAAGGFAADAAQKRAARRQADQLEVEKQYRINDINRQRYRVISTQRQAYGFRGVKLSGSPLEVMAETNELARLDILRTEQGIDFRIGEILTDSKDRSRGQLFSTIGGIFGSAARATAGTYSAITATPTIPAGVVQTLGVGSPLPF